MAIVRPPGSKGPATAAPGTSRMSEALQAARNSQAAADAGGIPPMPANPNPGFNQNPRPVAPSPYGSTIPTPNPVPVVPANGTGNTLVQGSDYAPTAGNAPTSKPNQSTNAQEKEPEDYDKAAKKNKILIIAAVALVVIIGSVLILKFKAGNNNSGDEGSSGGFGGLFGNKTPTPTMMIEPSYDYEDDESQYIVEDDVPKYNAEEIRQLRAVGYSTDEIEAAGAMMIPVSEMVQQAEAERQAWLDEAIKPLLDTTSEEYKANLKNSWLGLPEVDNIDDFRSTGSIYEKRKNLDYEKINNYGMQLFIKIYLDNTGENYFFHQVTPSEYFKLEDSGNVIVTYQYMCPLVMDSYGYLEDETRKIIINSRIEIID